METVDMEHERNLPRYQRDGGNSFYLDTNEHRPKPKPFWFYIIKFFKSLKCFADKKEEYEMKPHRRSSYLDRQRRLRRTNMRNKEQRKIDNSMRKQYKHKTKRLVARVDKLTTTHSK